MEKKRKALDARTQRTSERQVKRQRRGGRVQLLDLSDEILLRSLCYLDIRDLVICDQVCSKLRGLANDNEIWKEKYYNDFICPRARRIPRLRLATTMPKYMTSRTIPTEQSHILDGINRDWKKLFKIKHNWTCGRAHRSELPLHTDPLQPVHAKVHSGELFTVDAANGLRAWRSGVVAVQCSIPSGFAPSALEIQEEPNGIRIIVADIAGNVILYTYKDGLLFANGRPLPISSSTRPITLLALSWPYMMSMDTGRNVKIHRLQFRSQEIHAMSLTTLHSEAILYPAALSLRQVKNTLVAGIAYTFSRLYEGWCLGLQEVRMPLSEDCHSAYDVETPSLTQVTLPRFTTRSTSSSAFALHPDLRRAPSSISYCGCYIMVGLPDNTLMVYLVRSTEDVLTLDSGRRLWGHTSAVSAAQVTPTGKAVSISAYSDEMRYWELEDVLTSHSQKRASISIQSVPSVSTAFTSSCNRLGISLKDTVKEAKPYRHGVSFDHEQAIVVERSDHGHVISCFSFA